MLPMPDQESVRLRSLPWVLLTVMLCYLLVLVTWQAREPEQRQELLSWYQESGLFEMEWDIYLSWLRFNGQRTKAQRFEQARADGELMTPFLDMAFNPRFEAENRDRGLDYWSPRRFDQWKDKRAAFKQRAKSLPSYFAGLRPSDPRPGRFVTWHFLQHGLIAWALMLVVLVPFAWPLEARLGKGPTVLLWLLGGVLAGLGPVWLFPRVYDPVIGSSGVISALIGGFASLHGRERLRFRYFHPRYCCHYGCCYRPGPSGARIRGRFCSPPRASGWWAAPCWCNCCAIPACAVARTMTATTSRTRRAHAR